MAQETDNHITNLSRILARLEEIEGSARCLVDQIEDLRCDVTGPLQNLHAAQKALVKPPKGQEG